MWRLSDGNMEHNNYCKSNSKNGTKPQRSNYKAKYNVEAEEVNEAIRTSVEALEKTIPKKIHYVSIQSLLFDEFGAPNGWCDQSHFECPTCGLQMDFWDEDCYCYGCGQHLAGTDFEDEQEDSNEN